jgi:hypothetical protein
MRKLVWIHAGRKPIMLDLSWHGSNTEVIPRTFSVYTLFWRLPVDKFTYLRIHGTDRDYVTSAFRFFKLEQFNVFGYFRNFNISKLFELSSITSYLEHGTDHVYHDYAVVSIFKRLSTLAFKQMA